MLSGMAVGEGSGEQTGAERGTWQVPRCTAF
jgi:hypothetical protein